MPVKNFRHIYCCVKKIGKYIKNGNILIHGGREAFNDLTSIWVVLSRIIHLTGDVDGPCAVPQNRASMSMRYVDRMLLLSVHQ